MDVERFAGWVGEMRRVRVEAMLDSEPEGTYVLRKVDELAGRMVFHLARENHLHVDAYLLTARVSDRIAEVLLLKTKRGWTYYNDNPDLSESVYFPSLEETLRAVSIGWFSPAKTRAFHHLKQP